MKTRDFEELVRQAVEGLPEQFLLVMENVDVQVQDWPTREKLRESGLDPDAGETLFGLYEGVPLTDRDGYNMVLPDLITIFQGPIEESCGTPEEVVREVRDTVVHEIAHHFGISDDELEEWGVA